MWFNDATFYYYDTGESYRGQPARIIFTDPMLYFDSEGRQIIPQSEWSGSTMKLQEILTVPLADVKRYLKVEHDQEDQDIEEWTEASIEVIGEELSRGWPTEEDVPAAITLAVKMNVAYWYENRGDIGDLSPDANRIVAKYSYRPGM